MDCVERTKWTGHGLRGATEHRARELDQFEALEDTEYRFASHGNVVR